VKLYYLVANKWPSWFDTKSLICRLVHWLMMMMMVMALSAAWTVGLYCGCCVMSRCVSCLYRNDAFRGLIMLCYLSLEVLSCRRVSGGACFVYFLSELFVLYVGFYDVNGDDDVMGFLGLFVYNVLLSLLFDVFFTYL
jgi:hypothetical protein